ncbi:MAG: hypothetical protein KJ709_00025 [Nanoarchaeota archaeon]|nr:hypothetical protein [Nanoarchaeota archaeon]
MVGGYCFCITRLGYVESYYWLQYRTPVSRGVLIADGQDELADSISKKISENYDGIEVFLNTNGGKALKISRGSICKPSIVALEHDELEEIGRIVAGRHPAAEVKVLGLDG